ncbi:MAG: LysR family transcriptional regulator [Pseudomonadota bacterium]
MKLFNENLSSISLDVLHLFVRVATLGSIAAAARELETAPSVASRKIAALERALGARLLQRTTRRLKLTESGEIVLRSARQAIESITVASDDLAALADRPAGRIRLAANHFAAHVLLPPLLAQFGHQHPHITFSITISDSLVDMVSGGFDVAIHSGRIPDSSLIGLRVVEFRRVLCAAPAYLAKWGTPRIAEDLRQHRCLVHSSNESATWFFRRGTQIAAQPIRASIDADSHLLILAMVRQGLGIARLARDVINEDLASGRLVEILQDHECVYSNGTLPALWIAYPSRQLLNRVRLFVDFLAVKLNIRS